MDPSDSVGVIDSYFPEASFFTEFERFDRHLDKCGGRAGEAADYISICSPNYLHDSPHALRAALGRRRDLREAARAQSLEHRRPARDREFDRLAVNTILQLRVHPAIVALREKVQAEAGDRKHEVDLTYITSRGLWYQHSWKGDVKKSGGIATNIGVHFFDMLHFIFGGLQENVGSICPTDRRRPAISNMSGRGCAGSSRSTPRPPRRRQREAGQRTYRSITVDGEEIEFSGGFTDLHTRSYELILEGKGFGLEENRCAIETVADIRTAAPIGRRATIIRSPPGRLSWTITGTKARSSTTAPRSARAAGSGISSTSARGARIGKRGRSARTCSSATGSVIGDAARSRTMSRSTTM
jgi:UDP-N-acetyl-2-amino-2-deoxyglucuronate dehydrogenase